jgi:hypothetical protein
MEKTLRVLNRMVKDGVIEQYAIGGAVAAIFYVEPSIHYWKKQLSRLRKFVFSAPKHESWRRSTS